MIYRILFLFVDFEGEKCRELLSDLAVVRIHKYQATSGSPRRSAPTTTRAGKRRTFDKLFNDDSTFAEHSRHLSDDGRERVPFARASFIWKRAHPPARRIKKGWQCFKSYFRFQNPPRTPPPPSLASPPLDRALLLPRKIRREDMQRISRSS